MEKSKEDIELPEKTESEKNMDSEEINRFYFLFLNGDEAAFEKIMATLYKDLIFFINRYIGNVEVSEEIAADTFVRLLENKRRFDPKKASLKTFLFTVGRNLALDYLRKYKRYVPFSELENVSAYDSDIVDALIKKEEQRKLSFAINKLPQLHRTVFHLMYFENMSYDDISKILKIPVKKLYEVVREGKDKLKKIMKE